MITRRLSSTLPDVEFIYAMTPPELARYVLDDLNEQVNVKIGGGKENNFNLRDYIGLMRQHGTPYPGEEDRRLDMAIGEAWGWMLANGILLPNPWYPNAGYHCVTRVGLEVKTAEDFEGLRRRHALPREMLHPSLSQNVWFTYIRGEMEAAVMLAFKEIEVEVREAAKLGDDLYGDRLIRKAFNENHGPLTDLSAQKSERLNMANFFAGAFGVYRNPIHHRRVRLDDPTEAAELLMLASHLLWIVDERKIFVPL